ncbi:MAG: HAD family phosphatase [Planctomycetes bacterium]|nr:HAD family phosphatase [Planctomycetota bacterium]
MLRSALPNEARKPAESQAPHVLVRAIIFDLDNVLVWSVPMHWKAFQRTFEAEGRSFPFEEYLRVAVGAAREEVIRHVMGEIPEPRLRLLMDEKERHVREYLREKGLKTIPGALDFVRAARERGLKTAVASASRTPELILDGVGVRALFHAVVGRTQVARSKPHPDLFLRAAEALEVEPSECLVVEDSAVGVEAARAAGMRVLALTTTEASANLSRADAVYGGFREIELDRWLG